MKAFILAPYLWSNSIGNQLAASWPWEQELFGYDPTDRGNVASCVEGGQFDGEILERVRVYQPDIVVYNSMSPEGNSHLGGIPKKETFHALRELAPVLHLCCDGGDDGWRRWLKEYHAEERFDACVNVDGCKDWPLASRKRCWVALTPVVFPASVLVRPLAERATPFSFCGAVSGTRPLLINKLRELAGLAANSGGAHEGTYAEYLGRLADSRVTLNMPWSASQTIPPYTAGVRHVKGRVLEAGWAGCCLLEGRGAATADWFTPGKDYAEYEGADEAARAANALLADLPSAQRMANSLHHKVVKYHSPQRFWDRVLREVGLLGWKWPWSAG